MVTEGTGKPGLVGQRNLKLNLAEGAGGAPISAGDTPTRPRIHLATGDATTADQTLISLTSSHDLFDAPLEEYRRFRDGNAKARTDARIKFSRDGIHFVGIRFTEPVSLASMRLDFGVHFLRCEFYDVVDARWAHLDFLTMKECVLHKPLLGSAIEVGGNIDFSDSTSCGQIDLAVAKIQGDLVLVRAKLEYFLQDDAAHVPDVRRGAALFCGGLTVHSILMDNIRCSGRIFLDASVVRGIIKAGNATLERSAPRTGFEGRWEHVVFSAADTDIEGAVIFGEEGRGLDQPLAKQTFCARGQVSLSNSRIGGSLVCTNGKFYSAFCDADENFFERSFGEGNGRRDDIILSSLNVSRARIGGAVLLNNGFEAFGEVRFNSVEVRGIFLSANAIIDGVFPRGKGDGDRPSSCRVNKALSLDHAEIGNKISLTEGFVAFGQVTMRNAVIRGDLDCKGGTFHACWPVRENDKWQTHGDQPVSLSASGAEISGSVMLMGVAGKAVPTASGLRHLLRRQGNRNNSGRSTDKPAAFRSFGQVRFRGSRIQGNLHLSGGRFEFLPRPQHVDQRGRELPMVALFQSTKVGGTTFLSEESGQDRISACFSGSASFSRMQTGAWQDALEVWPRCRTNDSGGTAVFELSELTYNSLEGPNRGSERLLWLLQQPASDLATVKGKPDSGFRTQPWEQCAKVLYDMGYRRSARYLYRVEQRFLRIKGRMGFPSRVLNSLLGMFVGHGYRVLYAALWAVWLLSIGTIIGDYGVSRGYFVPAQSEIVAGPDYQKTHKPPAEYPVFHPLLYSVDTALPAASLHQSEFWTPIDTPAKSISVASSPLATMSNRLFARWTRQSSDNCALVAAMVIVAFGVGGFSWWLFHDTTITVKGSGQTTKRDARRLYRNILNHHRNPFPRFTLLLIVELSVAAFAGLTSLYFIDQSLLFRLLDIANDCVRAWMNVSLPHIWMIFETLLGWLLISAVVAQLAYTVFQRSK